MLLHHRIKRFLSQTVVSWIVASLFALSPLQPLLAQAVRPHAAPPHRTDYEQQTRSNAIVKISNEKLPLQGLPEKLDTSTSIQHGQERGRKVPVSNEQKRNIAPTQTPAAPGDADASFVSQTQASQKSTPLKADESSGALNYEYPLQVPAGRNGLQPDLRLSYNSQSLEDGSIFGYGWTISIPFIQRKNTHGTDKLYSSFDFTSALSGDLVATDAGKSTFIARIDDGGYLTYSLDANQTWTVRNKLGLTYVFGATAGDRQDDPTNPNHVHEWLLSSVMDANGNAIIYSYFKNNGQIYPERISYADIFEVNFLRSPRPDLYRGYRTGFSVTSDYLVSSIQLKILNSVSKSYVLTYSKNPTTNRSRLEGVMVQDANHAFPPTTFSYQVESAKGFDANYSSNRIPIDLKSGVFPADINADGYPDLIKAYEWIYSYYSAIKSISINHPESNNWQTDLAWQLPPKIMIDTDGAWNRNVDSGTRVVELNGDLKPDFIRYENICFICTLDQEVNTGTGWSETTNWFSPINTNGGTRTVIDLNGDGLTDVLGTNGVVGSIQNFQTSISENNGSDFTTYGHYSSAPPNPSLPFTDAPEYLSDYLEVDINADGLPDLVKSSWYWGNPTSRWDKRIYLNTGSGWAEDTAWTFPDVCYFCQGSAGQSYNPIYFQDFNNDGYVDFVIPGAVFMNNQQVSYSNMYINNGHGWTEDTGWSSFAYFYSQNCFCQNPGLFFDGNADGSPDIYVSNQSGGGPPLTNIFENKNHNQVDLLSAVTLPTGGTIGVTYKASTQYRDAVGNLLNPKLPLIIWTVEKITTDDKNGNSSSVSYSYADGNYFYNGPFDRKLAGFGAVTTTDVDGNVRKTYFHQGNENNQTQGEYGDEYWKIGRPFRVEKYDSAGNLYSRTVNKWDSYSLGGDARFVKLSQTLESAYDGNSSHKDKAESYTYDDSTGNVTQKVTLGEVNGNDDGTFTDIGNDALTTTIAYATGSSLNVTGRPSQETTMDQTNNKVKDTKYYYDTLLFGTVAKGNLTRQEEWKEGAAYVHTTRTYNNFGLLTAEADARDKVTSYGYDAFNLYPVTVTNPLTQETKLLYDYATGKVTEKADPNGNVFQTTYDSLGRVLEEKVPDVTLNSPATTLGQSPIAGKRLRGRPTNGAQLVTKSSYVYNDIGVGSSVKQTEYLDSTLSHVSYSYLDGLGREIQTRKQTETTNKFSVKDLVYNQLGLLQKQSLAYFSTGSAKTAATASSTLYTSYNYDALQRVKTVTTAVGATTNTFDDWMLTVTDANGKPKDLFKDAYDRLVRVDEHNGVSIYTTRYDYNGLGKLIKITDAKGNVRAFTYDGLGRRRTMEDLHAAVDATFGSWTFNFDDTGNLSSRLDPNGQTCNYTYDDLNRLLTEDFAGQAGIEVSYTYDSCANGIGHLCSVSNGSLIQNSTYNVLGLPATEDKTIDSFTYHTAYGYDRQGNQTKIVSPDSSEVAYQYNNGGMVERVLSGPSGSADLPVVISNIDYSPMGQMTVMQYGNGAVTTNTYDATRLYRLQRKVTLLPNGGAPQAGETPGTVNKVAQDLTYSYDNVGNVISIVDASDTDARKTITYAYDDLYRLISATTTDAPNGTNYTQTYAYDAVGNISNKSDQGAYSYAGNTGNNYANPHAVTQIEKDSFKTNFQYDRNGNLISINDLVNNWDNNNRMVKTTLGSSVITYGYDQNGQRVKYSNGIIQTVYPSRYYNLSKAETSRRPPILSADNAVKHIFIGDLLVATVKGSLRRRVYAVHTDHLSGSNVISNGNGQIEELTDYYPFGDIRLEQNSGNFVEQRKFTGHELDADTGLTYMNARYYNSSIGRFISEDAVFLQAGGTGNLTGLKDPQSMNSYSYANNNPLTNVDLDGNFSFNALEVSIGNWANNLYDHNSVARAALDHPYAPAIIGAAPWAIYVGGPAGVINGAVNVGSDFLNAKVKGKTVSAEEYGFSFVTGAFDVRLPGGPLAKAAVDAAENVGQQKLFNPHEDIDWVSVVLSAGSTATADKLVGLHPSSNVTINEITKTATKFVTKHSVQLPYEGVSKALEQKKKGN